MPTIDPVPLPLPAALATRMARLVPATMAPPTLFRSVARNEGLFCHLVDSGLIGPTGLLDRRVLPRELREALILRTCAATGNAYEWQLHVGTISARMGLTAAQIENSWSDVIDPGCWDDAQRAALALVDTLVARRPFTAELRAALHRHHGPAQQIEMTQLIGLYAGVAMLVALIEPELDAYAAPLPANAK